MRRRIAAALACFATTALLAGCMGAEGKHAEALLQRATLAQDSVTSERFLLRAGIDVDGQSMTMVMQGGAYLKGKQAGDFYVTVSGSGVPEISALDMTLTQRGNVAAIRSDGRTERMSVPAAEDQFGSPTDMLEITRYVKSVSVDETTLRGRPADRIVGTLDTQAMLKSGGSLVKELLDSAGVHVGDIRAMLLVPRDTHLVQVTLADLDVTAHGEKAHMHLSLSVSDINKPVSIPQV